MIRRYAIVVLLMAIGGLAVLCVYGGPAGQHLRGLDSRLRQRLVRSDHSDREVSDEPSAAGVSASAEKVGSVAAPAGQGLPGSGCRAGVPEARWVAGVWQAGWRLAPLARQPWFGGALAMVAVCAVWLWWLRPGLRRRVAPDVGRWAVVGASAGRSGAGPAAGNGWRYAGYALMAGARMIARRDYYVAPGVGEGRVRQLVRSDLLDAEAHGRLRWWLCEHLLGVVPSVEVLLQLDALPDRPPANARTVTAHAVLAGAPHNPPQTHDGPGAGNAESEQAAARETR